MGKKNVLILIPHFLPGYKMGGPLKSILHLLENLSSEFNFKVLTADRDMGDEVPYPNVEVNSWIQKDTYQICYVPVGLSKMGNMVKQINSAKADIIYLNGLFHPTFSIAIVFLAKFGIVKTKKIILAPRGETYDEALDFKKSTKKIYLGFAKFLGLYKNVKWHASTETEKTFILKNMNVKAKNIHVAINLPSKSSFPEFLPAEITKVIDTLYLVFIARISKDKNILFTFEVLMQIKTKVIFDVFGPIEDSFIWEACKEKIKSLPQNVKVNYKGPLAMTAVKKTFNEYDLMFLPTFAENYGHSIVESLSVGTPVLISDNTPWRNLQKQELGWDISLENPELFVAAIEQFQNTSAEDRLNKRKKRIIDFYKILQNPQTIEANKQLFTGAL